MKLESLQALIIDQHAGELLPEVEELLEAHIATKPALQVEVERIRLALKITSQTVIRHPELVRFAEREPAVEPLRKRPTYIPQFLKVAAVLMFASVTATTGFYIGSKRSVQIASENTAEKPAAPNTRKNSPWARYKMAIDPKVGGIQVVRVDLAGREERP